MVHFVPGIQLEFSEPSQIDREMEILILAPVDREDRYSACCWIEDGCGSQVGCVTAFVRLVGS